MQRYLDRFEAVHVVFFEEFIKDVEGHLREIFAFLAVDPSYAATIEPEVQNGYAIAPHTVGIFLVGTGASPASGDLSQRGRATPPGIGTGAAVAGFVSLET